MNISYGEIFPLKRRTLRPSEELTRKVFLKVIHSNLRFAGVRNSGSSYYFNKHFILVRVVLNPDSILGILGVRWEFTQMEQESITHPH